MAVGCRLALASLADDVLLMTGGGWWVRNSRALRSLTAHLMLTRPAVSRHSAELTQRSRQRSAADDSPHASSNAIWPLTMCECT